MHTRSILVRITQHSTGWEKKTSNFCLQYFCTSLSVLKELCLINSLLKRSVYGPIRNIFSCLCLSESRYWASRSPCYLHFFIIQAVLTSPADLEGKVLLHCILVRMMLMALFCFGVGFSFNPGE